MTEEIKLGIQAGIIISIIFIFCGLGAWKFLEIVGGYSYQETIRQKCIEGKI